MPYLDLLSVVVVVKLDVCFDDLGKNECLCVLFNLVCNLVHKSQGFSLVLRYCNHWRNNLDQTERVDPGEENYCVSVNPRGSNLPTIEKNF